MTRISLVPGVFILLIATLCGVPPASAQFQSRTDVTSLNNNAAIDTESDVSVTVAMDASGNWVAAWERDADTIFDETDIMVARSADYGATWSSIAMLDPAAPANAGDYSVKIVTDRNGCWVALWARDLDVADNMESHHIMMSRSINNGATWTAPVALTMDDTSYFSTLATNGAGNWVAMWSGLSNDLWVARSSTNGASWNVPVNMNNSPSGFSNSKPTVATDGAGLWVAVWELFTSGDDVDLRVARSTDNGATWTAPVALNTNAVTDSGEDFAPQIATDGIGNWTTVWQSNDSLGGSTGTDWDILAARSSNGGVSWSAPAALNSSAATDTAFDFDPELTTDGAGNWIASWNWFGQQRLLVSRSSNNGATWSAQEELFSEVFSAQMFVNTATVATDNAGRWAAIWEMRLSQPSQDFDIVYTRWSGILAPDWDGDNLSNADEATAGTNPNDWDSDNDGLSDEEEVNTTSTDPLDPDSDGDGVSDDIEISVGTDPNDPFDFPPLPLAWTWVVTGAMGIAALAALTLRRPLRR